MKLLATRPTKRSSSSCFPSPERLEERIAPAGLVSAIFANGLLSITGVDGADHDVTIVKTGNNTFMVQGNATDINQPGKTSRTFTGELDHVRIMGGTGADTFEVKNLDPLHTFRFEGDAGNDSLSTNNLRIVAGGRVSIDLGAGTGSVAFNGVQTTIQGALNIDLGGGGTALFGSSQTTIAGSVAITGGDSSDVVSITGGTSLFQSKFTFVGGDGDDSFTATGATLQMKGLVTMDGGGGSNHFQFAANRNLFGTALTPGLVDLNLGTGPGDVTFLGSSTGIAGDLKIDLGSGGGIAHLNSVKTRVRDNLQVTGGAGSDTMEAIGTLSIGKNVSFSGGADNDTLSFDGATNIGKNLTFLGGVGDEVLKARGSQFVVKGATNVDNGSGAEASIFDIGVVNLALAGLTVTGGVSNDQVSIVADGTISGNVDLQLGMDGTGPSSTVLQSRAGIANGLVFGGSLTIDMVGLTVDTLTIANIQVAKAFVAQTGENVSTVNISNLNAKSDFKLQTGSGADVVNIDNVQTRDFYIDTGIGADELRIERNATYTGISHVLGVATILTGIGADEIRIGNGGDPANLKVSFMGAMTLDAGDGPNERNDILGSNSFQVIPTITATGGTLTETAAV